MEGRAHPLLVASPVLWARGTHRFYLRAIVPWYLSFCGTVYYLWYCVLFCGTVYYFVVLCGILWCCIVCMWNLNIVVLHQSYLRTSVL